jgi:outer membrane receptor protein involved in Fe transport
MTRMFRPLFLLICLFLSLNPAIWADGNAQVAAVTGTTYSMPDNRALPGVAISVFGAGRESVQKTTSDKNGRFALSDLPAGSYEILAELQGFEPSRQIVEVKEQNVASVEFRLQVAQIKQIVEVESSKPGELKDTSQGETVEAKLLDLAPLRGDNYQALLPLVPGVVRGVDGRISFKGAQPTQSGLLVGTVDATDASTGNFGYELPVDAVENVDVLTNPYSTEYGRFSSGVARVETHKGDNEWRFGLNNFIPRLKWRDGTVMGIGSIAPRLTFRGPLVADRLFLAQSMRYRHTVTRIPGLPDMRNDQLLESFESFSRIDTIISPSHSLTATAAIFPRKMGNVGLNSFNPIEVTQDFHQRGYAFVLADNAALSPKLILDTVVSFKRYDADVLSHGDEPMKLMVEGNQGSFFNRQERKTRTLQFAQSVTAEHSGDWGSHLFKAGYDVLHASLDGASRSRPVEIYDVSGNKISSITFSGNSYQRIRSTDLAAYLQDAWRINERVRLDLGLRLDRNGLLDRYNFSPRIGFTVSLRQQGGSVLRGGAGLFYDRTPLNVGAFESYENRTITDWTGDAPGRTVSYRNSVNGPLTSPYSFIWNLEFDHRFTNSLMLKVNHFRRSGFHEMILDPQENNQTGSLSLASRGRARYHETEISFRYYLNETHKLIWSYVRSRSEADLNSYDLFFGNSRDPFIRPNQYSLTSVDVPHRFMWRGVMTVWKDWIASPVLELRNGFAYSKIDERRDYVGTANQGGRFPRLLTVDLSVSKKVQFLRWKPRVGMSVYNLFNSFNPRDVQNNIQSSSFGGFYNTIPRSFGLIFQFEP